MQPETTELQPLYSSRSDESRTDAPRAIHTHLQSRWRSASAPCFTKHDIPHDLRHLIKKLQEQEKVFPDKRYRTPESILQRMDTLLDPIISGSLCHIYSTPANIPFVELICHAFFHQRVHNDSDKGGELHTKIVEPLDQLYGVLVAAYISNIMREMDNEEEEFKMNHKVFERTAYEIFDEMYKANRRKLEYHILAYDYERKFRSMDAWDEWKDSSRELLCVAYRGKCMKFLSHPACQSYIKTRWRRKNIDKLFEPGNRHYPSKTAEQDPNLPTTSVAVPVAPPIQTEHEIHCPTVPHRRIPGPTARQRIEQTSTAIWHSVISPQTKYFIHMILNAFFVVLFAFILIVKPYRAKYAKGENTVPFFWSHMFTYVTLTLSIDLVMQFIKVLCIMSNPRIYWWDFVKMRSLRSIILLCTTVYTAVWLLPFIQLWPSLVGLLAGLSELVYNTAFVISAASLLKYLSFFEYFGAKIELLKKMASSIINYMLLLLFFWVVYAVVYLSLTETTKNRNETTPWQFFEKGAFEILGEPKDEDRDGVVNSCNGVLWENINWTRPEEASCLFRSTLLPPVLLIYMFVAAVMLINVFTAMLSHEYEKTQERSKNYINFHRYHMLISFESKFLLPAPFNVLILLIWGYKLVVVTLNSCFRFNIPIFMGVDPHKWLNTPQGIGPKIVPKLINEGRIKELAKKVLERKGKHNFVRTVQDYINNWEMNNQSADGGIEEAEKILQTVIQKFREYLTAQTVVAQERIVAWEMSEMERRSTIGTPAPNLPENNPISPTRMRHHSAGQSRTRASTVIAMGDGSLQQREENRNSIQFF